VFAGGTSSTMEDFGTKLTDDEFAAAKGPDFVSRLKGHVNIMGPNPIGDDPAADPYYIIRRAVILRSILERVAPALFDASSGTPKLQIDRGVLRAFLRIDRYEHGVRSMETIVATSLLTGKRLFERSALQAPDQLDGQVDGHRFVALMQEAELEGELLERLAEAAHNVFCAGKRRDGFTLGPRDATKKTHPLLVPYAELPELYKESNRTTVLNIPKKLARAGYIMIQAREGDPRLSFSPQEVEELAEYEHELWMQAHLAEGWTLGTATPDQPKRNEYLVEWNALPDEIKTIDRDLVEGIPDILAAAGYTAIKIGSS
jgi:hypothetical protein